MKITGKIFWQQAMKGGTIIGLVVILMSALRFIIEPSGILRTIFSIVNIGLFVYLIYFFTNQLSKKADPAEGFSYGRCVGFSVCMMLFVGFLTGIYQYLMNNFIAPHVLEETLEASMSILDGMIPYNESDTYFLMMKNMQTNLFFLIFAGLFGYIIYGTIAGLITSAFAKKDPNVFAREDDEEDD